jgi:hypothetical protein
MVSTVAGRHLFKICFHLFHFSFRLPSSSDKSAPFHKPLLWEVNQRKGLPGGENHLGRRGK